MTVVTLPGVEHRHSDFELDPDVLAGLWEMEDRHFWHAARNRWILRALHAAGVRPGAKVLDVGCGAGSVARVLAQHHFLVTGIDTAAILVEKAHARCPEATFIAGNVSDMPSKYGPFDVVTLFDVLEHLDDPLALITSAIRLARPEALVMATVPALRSLHTVVDDLSGHKKRYEQGELAALLSAAGITDVEERGIFRAIGPLLRLSRRPAHTAEAAPIDSEARKRILLADARIPPSPVNGLLGLVCEAELRLGFGAARGKSGATLLATGRVGGSRNGRRP